MPSSSPTSRRGFKYPVPADAQSSPPAPCAFELGDLVDFTNDYGVKFKRLVVKGFSPTVDNGRFVYLDKSSWWFPVSPDSLVHSPQAAQASC